MDFEIDPSAAAAKRFKRRSKICRDRLPARVKMALLHFNSTDRSLAEAKHILPLDIAGNGLGEQIADEVTSAIGFQRLGQVPLLLEHIAYPTVGTRQFAEQTDVWGGGLVEVLADGAGEALGDGEAVRL